MKINHYIIYVSLLFQYCNFHTDKDLSLGMKHRRFDYQTALGESSSSETEEVTQKNDNDNDNEYNEKYPDDDTNQLFETDKIYKLQGSSDNDPEIVIINSLKIKYKIDNYIINELISFFTLDYFRDLNNLYNYNNERIKIYAEDKIIKFLRKIISLRIKHISRLLSLKKKEFCQLLSDHEYLYDNAICGIIADYTCELDFHRLFNERINTEYKKFLLMQCSKLEVIARRKEAQNVCMKYIKDEITNYTDFCSRYDRITNRQDCYSMVINSKIYSRCDYMIFNRITIFRGNLKSEATHKKRKYNLETTQYSLCCCEVSKLFLIQLAFIFFSIADIWLSVKYCFDDTACILVNYVFSLIFFPPIIVFLFLLSSHSMHYKDLFFYKAESEVFNPSKIGCCGRYDPLYPGYRLKSKCREKLESQISFIYDLLRYNCHYGITSCCNLISILYYKLRYLLGILCRCCGICLEKTINFKKLETDDFENGMA